MGSDGFGSLMWIKQAGAWEQVRYQQFDSTQYAEERQGYDLWMKRGGNWLHLFNVALVSSPKDADDRFPQLWMRETKNYVEPPDLLPEDHTNWLIVRPPSGFPQPPETFRYVVHLFRPAGFDPANVQIPPGVAVLSWRLSLGHFRAIVGSAVELDQADFEAALKPGSILEFWSPFDP